VPIQAITRSQVRGLFNLWNDALATLDSEKVADRYSKCAVLLPTLSNIPRNTRELLIDYFNTLLLKKPQAVILSETSGSGFRIVALSATPVSKIENL